MDKKKLDADNLRVESFDPAPDEVPARGTVHGNDATGYPDPNLCGPFSEAGYTCKYPTAIYDSCPAGWTDFEPECNIPMPITYYCCDGGGTGGAMC